MTYIIFFAVCVAAYFVVMEAFKKGGPKFYGFSCGFAAVVFMGILKVMAELFFI